MTLTGTTKREGEQWRLGGVQVQVPRDRHGRKNSQGHGKIDNQLVNGWVRGAFTTKACAG